jgi:hypothetical protein
LLISLIVGCSSKPADRSKGEDEVAVRAKFAELQSAIQNRDADKIWNLLHEKSRADADRTAKDIQAAYAKASAEEKAKQEEHSGLGGADMANLTGIGFLKTKRFQQKYHELPESKIEKVVVEGDNATVDYLEPDNDKEKLIFLRQEGQWKAWLAMPKAKLP